MWIQLFSMVKFFLNFYLICLAQEVDRLLSQAKGEGDYSQDVHVSDSELNDPDLQEEFEGLGSTEACAYNFRERPSNIGSDRIN